MTVTNNPDDVAFMMRQVKQVGIGPDDVDSETADRIVNAVTDTRILNGSATRLRETISYNSDDLNYEVYLAEYTLDGETRYAVVYSGPDEVTVDDHTDHEVAEQYYIQLVGDLGEAFNSGAGGFAWDKTDTDDAN